MTTCKGECGRELTFVTGRNVTEDGLMCDDCYYDRLGSLVEEFPIGHPGLHGRDKACPNDPGKSL